MQYLATIELYIEAESPEDAAVQADAIAGDPMRETFMWGITNQETGVTLNIDPADHEAEDISYKFA